MSDDAIVGGQAAGTGLSQVERVVDTFIAPSKTFTDILRSRSVWLPIVLSIIFSLATAWTMQKKVGFSQMYQTSLAQSPSQQEQMDSLPPDQRAARMKAGAAITEGIAYGYWAIGLIFAAIAALVLWGSFNFLAGAKTSFSEMFAVWIYAGLTGLVGAVLIVIMLLAVGGDNFNVQDPIGTNLGYFLGADSAHWLKSLLGSFDLLVFWFMALLIIGTSIVAKVKRSTAAAIIIGWWALLIVVKTAFAALMS